MLNKIISTKRGEPFIRFGNSDGKSWIVPIKNMSTELNL